MKNKSYDLDLEITKKCKQLNLGELLDAEKFLRLNPHWIIQSFESSGSDFIAEIKDHGTEEEFRLSGRIESENRDHYTVFFKDWLCAQLIISRRDDRYSAEIAYADPEFEEESEQERQVVLWLRSIKEYLRLYLKRTINTILFRTLMNRVILEMTPSQRKISLMLIRITVVELLVIVLIVIGYVYFVLRPSGAP